VTGRGFRIREARIGELDAAASVRARCWRESFGAVVPRDVLDNAEAWAPDEAERWASEMLNRGATYWLALDPAGEIVGVAHADAASEPDAPASLFLETLYVLDRAKGSGLAGALLHRAIGDELPAYLWVIEGNERAVAFYRRHAFEPDGVVRDITPGWPGGRALRMVRAGVRDLD
jgi:GNAT superfamily N-acetyltransferase